MRVAIGASRKAECEFTSSDGAARSTETGKGDTAAMLDKWLSSPGLQRPR
jgi:hypothetical protein